MVENTRLKNLSDDVWALQETLCSGRLDQLEQKLNAMMLANDPSRLDRLKSTMDSVTKYLDKLT